MSLTSAMQNTSGASPAIKAVSGKAASISGSGLSGLINSNNGQGDASAAAGKEGAITPLLFGPNNSVVRSKTTQNQQVTRALGTGVDNGVLGRTPRTPGPDGVGTPVDGRGSTSVFNSIGNGAAGDGRGVNGLSNQFGLLPSLLGAQLQTSFGGPPPGFGGASGQMPPINFGDMGLGGSGKKKGSEETPNNPPPQRNQGTPPQGIDPLGTSSQANLDRILADGRLLERNSTLFGEDNKLTNEGKETLNKRFKDIEESVDSTKQENVQKAFETFKENFGGNDKTKKEALDTFRKALEQEDIKSEPVINKLLGADDVTPQGPTGNL